MTVCVHGMGYIGLPTAAILASSGHDVVGYDTDPSKIDDLEAGTIRSEEPGLRSLLIEALDSGALTASPDPVPAAYHLICVPTPLDHETKRADLSYVVASAETIAPLLREGDTVILESTVPPRTTEDILRPILERDGFEAGSEFYLAHSPETVLPGDVINELTKNDRIVGGVGTNSTTIAAALYDGFVEAEIHQAPDPSTAEFVKLVQNTYRDVNIALANEIAKLAADYGVDSRGAISLANTHPRVDILQPGPGVGGHCIPLDPWFLGHESDQLDVIARARHVNDGMADYVVDQLLEHLPSTPNPTVAVLGIAYKGNIDDYRESPGLAIARTLQARPITGSEEREMAVVLDGGSLQNIDVRLHDDHVTDQTLDLQPLDEVLDGADAMIIATDHDEYATLDPEELQSLMDGRLVFDTRAVLRKAEWTAAGFDVLTL